MATLDFSASYQKNCWSAGRGRSFCRSNGKEEPGTWHICEKL